MKKNILLILFFTVWFVQGQKANEIDLSQGGIKQNFEEIYRKSSNYKEYKVIKRSLIMQLQKKVLDSLQKQRSQIYALQTHQQKLQDSISGLQMQLQTAHKDISNLQLEKDQMSFMGIAISKSNYQLIMWGLVSFLFLSLAYFIFMFKKSIEDTKHAKSKLLQVEEAYESFRSRALEREQLLKRQLIDEQKKHRD